MSRRLDDDGMYLAAGPLVAIFLGMALMPLRGLTHASNFTFAFMAVTIVVAEMGGRTAAVATALVSALSLDFFLTRPYLRLSIEDHHDVIAFVGLGVCGLIAAALGTARSARLARLEEANVHHERITSLVREWDDAAPLEPQLERLLRLCRETLPSDAPRGDRA